MKGGIRCGIDRGMALFDIEHRLQNHTTLKEKGQIQEIDDESMATYPQSSACARLMDTVEESTGAR